MATRRDFLRIAAAVPLSGTLRTPLLANGVWAETATNPATEPLYIGKPLSYWLARAASYAYTPEEKDLMESWMFRGFGQAAVPGLIEAMKEECGCLLVTELQMLASPATVRALTHALKHQHPNVRVGAVCSLYAIAFGLRRQHKPELVEPLREAIPVLADMLRVEQEPLAIKMAMMFLHDFGSSLEPAFSFSRTVWQCERPDLWVRAACRHPACFQAEEVVPLLAASLEDCDPAVRLAAAEALSAIQPDHPAIVSVFVDHVVHRDCRCAIGF